MGSAQPDYQQMNIHDTNLDNWGFKIKRLRESKHLTQEELADKAGIGRSRLSRIELGHYKSPSPEVLPKLAKGLNIDFNSLKIIVYEIVTPSGKPEDWSKFDTGPLLKVSVYPDYVRVHAGEAVSVIDYIYVDKPTNAPYNVKAYRVTGDCMAPELLDGDYVIVDHDREINNGDKVACICDGQLHVAKLKIIGDEFWLENRFGTKRLTDCQGIAKVTGSFRKYH
jgi:transcriptional regulator with XRE-family HTH domain